MLIYTGIARVAKIYNTLNKNEKKSQTEYIVRRRHFTLDLEKFKIMLRRVCLVSHHN